MYGTAACAILYVAVSAAVMGLVAHKALVASTAPFVPAFEAIFGNGTWAGKRPRSQGLSSLTGRRARP